MYICNECLKIYTELEVNKFQSTEKTEYLACFDEECYGELMKVHEALIEVVRELNKKWYGIHSCDIAKLSSNKIEIFIKFILDEDFEDVQSIPKGFSREFTTGRCFRYLTVYKEYDKNLSKLKLKKQIRLDVVKLIRWSRNLKPLKPLNPIKAAKNS
jgi:hypothetical protein